MVNSFLDKKFSATAVGSLPHTSVEEACQFVFQNFRDDIIFWPQLIKRSFLENMYVQFSQGLPGVVVEREKQKIFINTSGNNFLNEMEKTLGALSEENLDFFAISDDYALGFKEMLCLLKAEKGINYFKGQIIGPVSFGLTIKDENEKSVFYNKDLQEIITKSLALKAKWQIRQIKNFLPEAKIIIFIDEPYLVSVGSSYIPLKKDEIVYQINEVVSRIHEEGALAGIHCCGNTDWGMVLETKIDILNFDAYNFLDTILLYPEPLDNFFKRGGILAWGIVSTSADTDIKEIKGALIDKILKINKEKGVLKNSVIITSSCGTGTLNTGLAEAIHRLTVDIARELNNKKIR